MIGKTRLVILLNVQKIAESPRGKIIVRIKEGGETGRRRMNVEPVTNKNVPPNASKMRRGPMGAGDSSSMIIMMTATEIGLLVPVDVVAAVSLYVGGDLEVELDIVTLEAVVEVRGGDLNVAAMMAVAIIPNMTITLLTKAEVPMTGTKWDMMDMWDSILADQTTMLRVVPSLLLIGDRRDPTQSLGDLRTQSRAPNVAPSSHHALSNHRKPGAREMMKNLRQPLTASVVGVKTLMHLSKKAAPLSPVHQVTNLTSTTPLRKRCNQPRMRQ